MSAPVPCVRCGAAVRADRSTCPRCGESRRRAAAPPPVQRQTPRIAVWLLAAVVAACGSVLYLRATRPSAIVVVGADAGPATVMVDPSETLLQTAPAVTANDARRVGGAAYERGDVALAIGEFQGALSATPLDPEVLNDLAQALVRADRPGEAIQYLDRAIAISEGVWTYRFNRARAYAQMQEWARAVADYRDAARLFPDDYVTEYNLALALQATGDLAGALAGFDRAIALAPGQADFHLSHGRALEAARRPDDAVAAYRRFLELEPTDPDAGKVSAHIAQLLGDTVVPATPPPS